MLVATLSWQLHGLIVGEAASLVIADNAKTIAEKHGFNLYHSICIQHGHEVMLSIKVEPVGKSRDAKLIDATSLIEMIEIRTAHQECKWIFTEICRTENIG